MSRTQPADPTDKASKIIEAARTAFFEESYDAISMNEVAKRAGVAKQTVYSYYPSKDALFLAVLNNERQRLDTVLEAALITSPAAAHMRLRESGLILLELLLGPSLRAMFRVTASAVDRFPSLGKSVYETGIKQRQGELAEIFRQAAKVGALCVDDPQSAAEHFTSLVRGELFMHCLFDPSFTPSQAAKLRQVDQAVDIFLARYGVAGPAAR